MLAKIVDFQPKRKIESQNTGLTEALSFLNRVSAIVDRNEDFKTATRKIFAEVCTYTQWPIAHLYINTTQKPETYISNGIWFLENGFDKNAIDEFVTISEESIFETGKGLIGLIAQEKEAKAIEDVTVLAQFLRAEAAARNGVRGFFGFPILVHQKCVGVAELYSRQTGLLDPTALEIMQYVSSQLARLYERATHLDHQEQLIEQFQSNVQTSIQKLAEGSHELENVANGVQQQANLTNHQSDQVTRASNSIAGNMETLQQAMEDLVHIEGQTLQSSTTVNSTVEELAKNVMATLQELRQLGTLSAQIETIAHNVSEISSQVRMLGLNASIEAARAGIAGKGFAIVAGEIKSLAQQSEKSSQDISTQLSEIRTIADSSITCMQTVRQSMDMLENCTGNLSNVVDQQHHATQTIRKNLKDAQDTFAHIGQDIAGMGNASADLLGLAQDASTQVQTIKGLSETISSSSHDFIAALKN